MNKKLIIGLLFLACNAQASETTLEHRLLSLVHKPTGLTHIIAAETPLKSGYTDNVPTKTKGYFLNKLWNARVLASRTTNDTHAPKVICSLSSHPTLTGRELTLLSKGILVATASAIIWHRKAIAQEAVALKNRAVARFKRNNNTPVITPKPQ